MALALILSSHVAASRVGGFAQGLALSHRGIDPVCIPTVQFGRHPGWGPPGGAAVEDSVFRGMLEGVDANGIPGYADAVLTGYFASPGQVRLALETIRRVREQDRQGALHETPLIIVDPVMGDEGKGLYVKPDVASALASDLVPVADYVTPNAWELGHLTASRVVDPASAWMAASRLTIPVMVSSVPAGDEIGTMLILGNGAWMVRHPRLDRVPNGTGDLLAALFTASLLEGCSPQDALSQAAGSVWACLRFAAQWQAPELPIVALRDRLGDPSLKLDLERVA